MKNIKQIIISSFAAVLLVWAGSMAADFTKSESIVKTPGAQSVKAAIEINESNLDDLITHVNTNLTANYDTDVSGTSWVVNEPTMGSNLSTKVPTQSSVKYYIENYITGAASTIKTSDVTASMALVSNASGKVTTSTVAASELALLSGKTSLGKLVQVQYYQNSEATTGTALIPSDGSIPQITEGDEYMTKAITPTSSSNMLKIDVVFQCGYSVSTTNIAVALFQDSTSNALATGLGCAVNVSSKSTSTITLTYYMTAGTTSSTTFKVRAGGDSAGTLTFNGFAGVDKYGSKVTSSITITEYEP